MKLSENVESRTDGVLQGRTPLLVSFVNWQKPERGRTGSYGARNGVNTGALGGLTSPDNLGIGVSKH